MIKDESASLDLLDATLPSPEENLALDEALLNEADQAARRGSDTAGVLRFWESADPFIVLGSTGRVVEEIQRETCHQEGIPVLRRSSGGGTVLAGPGCLFFSLILSLDRHVELRDIHGSYRAILGRLAGCLAVEGLEHRGISDLALDGRKVSGNSQRRKSHTLLHHGTVLYQFDLEAMARFLKDPVRQPEYRDGRPHGAFTTNLPLPAAAIKSRISLCWNARASSPQRTLPDLTDLIREKYGNPNWTKRF